MSNQWILPGPSSPYIVVWWNDEEAKDTGRRVSPSQVSRVLDQWLRSRKQSLREIYEALEGSQSLGLSGSRREQEDELLKKRLAEAFSVGRLVALTGARAAPQLQVSAQQDAPPSRRYGPFRIKVLKKVRGEDFTVLGCKQIFGLKTDTEARAFVAKKHVTTRDFNLTHEDVSRGFLDVYISASLYEEVMRSRLGLDAEQFAAAAEARRKRLTERSEQAREALRTRVDHEFERVTGRKPVGTNSEDDRELWALLQDEVLRQEETPSQRGATPVAVIPGKKVALAQSVERQSPEGEEVNDLGIVIWDGAPVLRLRASPSTKDDNVIGGLPFNTLLHVVKRLPGRWLQVSTRDGRMGYVSADYVWLAPQHPLPEPNVRLHRVVPGLSGTAIAIAEAHFENIRWGQDLGFYVAVLAAVNKRPIPRTVKGWKELRFQAGELIWVPSQEFAEALRGQVSSGSYSYEAAAELGVARALERIGQLQADFRKAIRLALRHIGPAVRRHVEESIVSILTSLLLLAAGAVVLLALSTLIGAVIGFVLGAGAGAAPGAAAGFKVGLALMEWLGLGFLLKWIGDSVTRIGSAFARFFTSVCNAHGDHEKLEQAALELAEAIGICAGVLVEALVMWAAAKGVQTALGKLKGTAFARAFGESRLGTWLRKRVGEYKESGSKLPSPREVLSRVQVAALAKELGITKSAAEALLSVTDAVTLKGLKGELGTNGLNFLGGKPRVFREAFFKTLEQVGTDGVARASLMESLRLNQKGTLANSAMQSALNAYLAFLTRHGQRVSGDFMSRFWRANALDKAEALAELRLVEDILAGKTPLGPGRQVKGLAESPVPGEKMPEFRVELPSGSRLAECKAIGEAGKPLSATSVSSNVSKAHSQLKAESARSGEAEGLIRLDAREAGNTDVSTAQLAEWASKNSPNPRDSRATRWVEIFYKNVHGQLVRVVLELKSGRFAVHFEQVMK
ncbi:SH3 domain-containing protein [Archangium gephyra]|uniref:SH3 domain-containing protein n=1 Tax=Archangium gephyra TaxID=48 RepID=UPI0035D4ED67